VLDGALTPDDALERSTDRAELEGLLRKASRTAA
jgi:hypothetical protein